MKKILSFIVVATMLMATVLTASAAPELGIGLVPVLYANSDMINVDGNIEATEWDETNSIMLSTKTNMATWTTDYPGEIQFFYSWGDDGLYMAAKVIDSTLTFTTLKADNPDDVGSYQDRFQIAFNPCGLIYDMASGLFFSFYPVCTEGTTPAVGDAGEVQARKHNWETGISDDQTRITEAGYKGAYTVTEDGWDMEVILPWSLIATQDRIYDIIDDETDAHFCSVFDPKNEDRTKAFTEAIIAYVDMESADGVTNTARTVKPDSDPDDWKVASYDITLKFYMQGESTDDKTVTEYTIDELKAIFKDVDWTAYDEAQNPDTSDEEDDPDADDTAAGNEETDAATNAPATGNDSASTTTGDSADEDGGSPVIWIVIAAVAVVAIAAVAIVISKKKK